MCAPRVVLIPKGLVLSFVFFVPSELAWFKVHAHPVVMRRARKKPRKRTIYEAFQAMINWPASKRGDALHE